LQIESTAPPDAATALAAMFAPRGVAVLGATEGTSATGQAKLGAAAVEYLLAHGYEGELYPVNPSRTEVLGRRCYPSVTEIEGQVDLALIILPAAACPQAMRECAAKGVKAAVVLSSGFSEAGEEELEAELVAIAHQGGIRFTGPNTAGVVGVGEALCASFSMVCSMESFRGGEIAFVTQSGALGGSLLGRGMDQGIGFSHWISTGNEADLTTPDYIEYLIAQDSVKVITLFLEGVSDGERFREACDAAAEAGIPIIAYKTGRSEVAARAAASHTGALAGSDAVFEAICAQHGVVRVEDVGALFSVALAFAWAGEKLPGGRNLASVSGSGGIGGVAADECELAGMAMPELSTETQEAIRAHVPAFAAVGNPVDVTGQIRSSPTGYQEAVRQVLADPDIDGVLLLVTMVSEPRASFYGREISKLAAEAEKPVIVAWCGALSVAQEGYPMLSEHRVPNFLTVREAVRAMAALAGYGAFRARRAKRAKEAVA